MSNIKMSSIVVGVDFSDYSKVVAAQARVLARALRASLTFVFSYEDFALYEIAPPFDRRKLESFYEKRVRTVYRVTPDEQVKIDFGRAERTIVAFAKSQPNPLIVVGYQSGRKLAHFFLGSVSEGIVANSKCPVWIQRGRKVALPKKILVPSDLSPASELAIKEGQRFAKMVKGSVAIYHVLREPTPVLDYPAWVYLSQSMRAKDDKRVAEFKKRHAKLEVFRALGDVADTIVRRAKKAGLIILKRRTSTKAKLLFGSVSSKIVRSGDTPILLIP